MKQSNGTGHTKVQKEVLEFMGQTVGDDTIGQYQYKFDDYVEYCNDNGMSITTLEGTMLASVGDYIIKGIQDEFYPCKPDIFDKTYERAQ